MKRYQCHKIVEAGKISKAEWINEETCRIHLFDGDAVDLDKKTIDRIADMAGGRLSGLINGYLMDYLDEGYNWISWSPTGPFEAGYSEMEEKPWPAGSAL